MGLLTILNIGGCKQAKAAYRQSRPLKAQSIADVLGGDELLSGARVLDYGAGSGLMAQAFTRLVGPTGQVVAADVADSLECKGLDFVRVVEGRIPEPDASFDVIISNHVLEHVGPTPEQMLYLKDCRRLLHDEGVLYLAMPNRWTVFEGHYRLPFVSWWPTSWRAAYLRLLGALGFASPYNDMPMDRYRVWPHSRRQLRRLLERSGFEPSDVTRKTMRRAVELELSGFTRRVMRGLVPLLYWVFRPVLPTHIFICRKA